LSRKELLKKDKGLVNLKDNLGNTGLHYAANAAHDETVEELLKAKSNPNAVNNFGDTPLHLAAYRKQGDRLFDLLLAKIPQQQQQQQQQQQHGYQWNREWFASRKDESKKLNQELEKKEFIKARQRKAELLETIKKTYKPLHPDVYEINDNFIEPSILKCLQNNQDNSNNNNNDVNSSSSATMTMMDQLKELVPKVFHGRILTESFSQKLLEESENFLKFAKESGLKISAPNSMNRYGLILNDMGMKETIDKFISSYLQPIIKLLFPRSERTNFKSHHSFIVSYNLNEDRDLKPHRDDSNFTFNLCLGKEFSGAELYFHRIIEGACTLGDDPNMEHTGIDCPNCILRYKHNVGECLIHSGTVVHGVDPLVSGSRTNLIIWCRVRKEESD